MKPEIHLIPYHYKTSSSSSILSVLLGFFSPRIVTTEKIIIAFQEQFLSLILHAQKEHKNKTRWTVACHFKSKVWQEKHQTVSFGSLLGRVNLLLWGVKSSEIKITRIITETPVEGKNCDKFKMYCYQKKKILHITCFQLIKLAGNMNLPLAVIFITYA